MCISFEIRFLMYLQYSPFQAIQYLSKLSLLPYEKVYHYISGEKGKHKYFIKYPNIKEKQVV